MNIKNILFSLSIVTGFAIINTYANREQTNNSTLPINAHHRLSNEVLIEQLRRLRPDDEKPSDTTKTPITPDIIEHQSNMFKGRQRNFYRKRIYFGKDESGNDCYRSINEHAKNNPAFGGVELILFKEASYLRLRFNDSFEKIGTFADKDAHIQLIQSIAAYGGVWCPEQNAIIGGTRDKSICTRLAEEFAHRMNQTNKFKKIFRK